MDSSASSNSSSSFLQTPPLAQDPPLNLDLYQRPGGKYKPRLHTRNCTCGCGNDDNKYIKFTCNPENMYMEVTTFYFFSDGKSLEELKTSLSGKNLENWSENLVITRREVWGRRVYRKNKNRISQMTAYRKAQQRKRGYLNKKMKMEHTAEKEKPI